ANKAKRSNLQPRPPAKKANPIKVAAKRRVTSPKRAKLARPPASASPYAFHLDKNPANYQPLTPLTFLERSASTFPDTIAIIHGEQRTTYREFYARCRRLASALKKRGIGVGDTVAVLAPNIPPMLDAHYGIAMIGAVLNAINYRLSAQEVGFILDHGEAKVFLVDKEFGALALDA